MNSAIWLLAALALGVGLPASGQQATTLAQLIDEVKSGNSQIIAADQGARAARIGAPQQGVLPDPHLTVQQFSVGSPRPFAGYTNSDFAYIGIGVSQELPYPGKLRLRIATAERVADTKAAQANVVASDAVDAVKADYIQLAYLQRTLTVLLQSQNTIDQLIADSTERYKVGQGMQQDILQAQIERTNLLREITMHHQEMATVQAHLKGLLHRDQTSPDIVAVDLIETQLKVSLADLLDLVRKQNPQVQADTAEIRAQNAELASRKQERKPDFELGYQYENTDRKYRDYYMLSFSMNLPRKKRVDAEVGEAAEMLAQSKTTLDAHLQERLAETQQQIVRVTGDTALLQQYGEGLIPQSEAAYRAALSAYGSDKADAASVLRAFLSTLDLKLASAQVLEEHEAALARLETLTGGSLR